MPTSVVPLLETERKLWTAGSQALLVDDTMRICNRDPKDVTRYRFHWESIFRSGSVRRQYVRMGDVIVQTLFEMLDTKGIQKINVYDALPDTPMLVAEIGIPEGAVAEIFCACSSALDGSGPNVDRIYVYGYHFSDGPAERSQYIHIVPTWPAKAWVSSTRS